jgi:hypothetical protein
MKLAEEARKNFEREREARRTGTPRPAPQRTEVLAAVGEYDEEETVRSERTRFSQSEVRYAMQVGKHPSELTPAERFLARMD